MKASLRVAALASFLFTPVVLAQTPTVTLTRLECGSGMSIPVASFNDTYAYEDLKVQLTFSCYLIQHGSDYMVWDAGYGAAGESPPKTALVDLLKQLNVTPDQVKYFGISHYHDDHIGQAASFAQATLLIGKGDWDVLSSTQARPGWTADATHFHENYASDGIPTWNFNRADTLASLDRFKKIAKNLQATVIIQHDTRDINKLPAFPAAAK